MVVEVKRLSILLLVVLIAAAVLSCGGGAALQGGMPETRSWAKRIADSFLVRHPGGVTYDTGFTNRKWNYEQGVMLEALHQMWLFSGDRKYYDFIRQNIDQYVDATGKITSYDPGEYNLDNIAPGRALLVLYQETHEDRYRRAADTVRGQLRHQPRTREGGFWHKKIYPFQMWLDGLYMAEPFYAEYARIFNEPKDFDDIAHQFIRVEAHTRDSKTGLLYHGWDESRQQRWADSLTGRSPNFWGRAIGWYAMALVDVLDYFPGDHPQRPAIIGILQRLSDALLPFRDARTGLWFQVVDQAGRTGNYLEASASCMFVYAFAKGANRGYLDRKFFSVAQESFGGVITTLVTEEQDGTVSLHHTCKGAGLGGTPYRDGSYEYYVSEPQRTNDFKGFGPFLLAAIELERGARDVGKK